MRVRKITLLSAPKRSRHEKPSVPRAVSLIRLSACLLSLLLPAVALAGHLNLDWTAPSTNVDGSQLTDLASYRIYYGTGSGACGAASSQDLAAPLPNPIPGTVVSYQLGGLTTGTTYFVQVSAVDTGGNESTCSNEASAAALADGADTTAPTGSVTINSGAAYTNWTASTLSLTASDLVGVVGYYASTSATKPAATTSGWVAVTSTTSYSNSSVPFTLSTGDGTKTVYAWFKDAAGNISATASATIVLDQTAPTNGTLTATPSSGQVALSWAGFSDSGSGLATANMYKVVFATGGAPASGCTNATQLYQGTGTSYIHTGLANGTTYYYRVCAKDNAGTMSGGAAVTAVPQPPNPVSSVQLSPDKAAPQLTGTPITFTASASGGVTPYQYKWWLWNGTSWSLLQDWTASATFTWTPPAANPDYWIGVWARSAWAGGDDPKATRSIPFAVSGQSAQ